MDDRQGSLRNSTPVWVGSPPGTGWGREHGPTTGSQNLPTSPFHFIYSLLSSLPVPTVTHFNVGFETFLLGKITNRYKTRQNRESLCGLPDKDLAFSLLWFGSDPLPRGQVPAPGTSMCLGLAKNRKHHQKKQNSLLPLLAHSPQAPPLFTHGQSGFINYPPLPSISS